MRLIIIHEGFWMDTWMVLWDLVLQTLSFNCRVSHRNPATFETLRREMAVYKTIITAGDSVITVFTSSSFKTTNDNCTYITT